MPWRPITLLPTEYKGLAKMISKIIHDMQTLFDRDRSILDNMFTFFKVAQWAQHERQHLAILRFDFEKANDKVDWDFLERTLLRLGFPHWHFRFE